MEAEPYTRRPEGPVAVAILSVCSGVFALGVASLVNQALNPSQWIPIPGVTSPDELQGGRKMVLMWSNFAQMTALFFILIIVWLVVWIVLYEGFARRRRVSRRWYVISAVLLVAGLVLSFPPFYQRVFREPVTGPMRLGRPFTYTPAAPAPEGLAAARAAPAGSAADPARPPVAAQPRPDRTIDTRRAPS
jgi:hypothetical protein